MSRCGAAVALVAAACTVAAAAAAAVPLPSLVGGRQGRLLLAAVEAGQFGTVENHAPGPVTVHEEVRLEIAPAGEVGPVRLRQTLTVTGTGDYILEMPSGAVGVAPIETSDNDPGLRQGTVLWEGFSGGEEQLAADVTLGPDLLDRAPVTVTTRPAGEDVELRIAARRASAPAAVGDPEPSALAEALRVGREVLGRGGTLTPGADGLPTEVPVTTTPEPVTVESVAPVHVTGTVTFAGSATPVDVTLPSADAPDGVLLLTGATPIVPDLTLEVVPVTAAELPAVEVPSGADAAAVEARRAALTRLDEVVLRSQLEADLLPLLPGFVDTVPSVSFRVVAGEAPPIAAARPADDEPPADPPRAPALVALGLVLLSGAALWARS